MVPLSWITNQIAVSGAFSKEMIPFLKSKGISAIIDVRSEYSDDRAFIENEGIKFMHVGIDDCYCPTFGQLEEIFSFVIPLLDEGKKILVHCQNGCGRSPMIVVAILAKRGMNVADAIYLVEDKHPWTSFTLRQERFVYVELDRYLSSENQLEG